MISFEILVLFCLVHISFDPVLVYMQWLPSIYVVASASPPNKETPLKARTYG